MLQIIFTNISYLNIIKILQIMHFVVIYGKHYIEANCLSGNTFAFHFIITAWDINKVI